MIVILAFFIWILRSGIYETQEEQDDDAALLLCFCHEPSMGSFPQFDSTYKKHDEIRPASTNMTTVPSPSSTSQAQESRLEQQTLHSPGGRDDGPTAVSNTVDPVSNPASSIPNNLPATSSDPEGTHPVRRQRVFYSDRVEL